jgi:peroxiredoxin family protein
MAEAGSKALSILLLSGGRERLVAAVNLAASARALGREVHLFLSWEPLLRLARDTMDEAPLPNSLGEAAGRAKAILDEQPPIAGMLTELRKGGMKLYACSNTLQLLGIDEAELEGKVDAVSGATAFLAMSEHAQLVNL